MLWCRLASYCLQKGHAGKDMGFSENSVQIRQTMYWGCVRSNVTGSERVVTTPFLPTVGKIAPEMLSHVGTPISRNH